MLPKLSNLNTKNGTNFNRAIQFGHGWGLSLQFTYDSKLVLEREMGRLTNDNHSNARHVLS